MCTYFFWSAFPENKLVQCCKREWTCLIMEKRCSTGAALAARHRRATLCNLGNAPLWDFRGSIATSAATRLVDDHLMQDSVCCSFTHKWYRAAISPNVCCEQHGQTVFNICNIEVLMLSQYHSANFLTVSRPGRGNRGASFAKRFSKLIKGE